MITVTQLIAMLTRFPGDLRLVVRGYDDSTRRDWSISILA
jgi:hypothetical protein